MSQLDFTVDVFQNEYLPDGSRDVNAIVTVTSADDPAGVLVRAQAGPGRIGGAGAGPGGTGGPSMAEIIIIDCSGSMSAPSSKMAEARAATSAAIDVIRDGVAFAVVAGTRTAWPVFPPDGSMAYAGPASRKPPGRPRPACRRRAGPRSASGCAWPGRSSPATRPACTRGRPRCGTPSC